jgi:thiol-disulfide isomerase/thioredoxin
MESRRICVATRYPRAHLSVSTAGPLIDWEESMLEATTVVTPARFKQGLSYADFLEQAKVNRDKFEKFYNDPALTDEDIAFFKRVSALPGGPAKILALAEDWCGDVYRELPTIVRIAEATGAELRVFRRDENPDIMDEYLSNNGKSRAIPVFVFFTNDQRYIAHFVERSAGASRELSAAIAGISAKLGLPPGTSYATVPDASRTAFVQELITNITPRFAAWRTEAIREMRALLSTALHTPEHA